MRWSYISIVFDYLRFLHHDGDAHQVVIRNCEVHNCLSLSHYTESWGQGGAIMMIMVMRKTMVLMVMMVMMVIVLRIPVMEKNAEEEDRGQ